MASANRYVNIGTSTVELKTIDGLMVTIKSGEEFIGHIPDGLFAFYLKIGAMVLVPLDPLAAPVVPNFDFDTHPDDDAVDVDDEEDTDENEED